MAPCAVKLVYCAGGNRRYMEIAVGLGYHTGSRSDDVLYPVHRPLYLLDCHWERYDWERHLRVVIAERPSLAVVPDILRVEGLATALAQAAALAPYCAGVVLVPKVAVVRSLPREVGGVPVVLGYSVPSRYGSTEVDVRYFRDWPVHLLGGTPLRQIEMAGRMRVVSADGNMAQKIAHQGLVFNARGHGERLDPAVRVAGRGMPEVALGVSLWHAKALWERAGYVVEGRVG